jgi:hypothetical protein
MQHADMNTTHQLDRQTVSELAQRLWEARGGGEGHALDDWLAAERQLLREQTADSKPVGKARSPPAKKRARAKEPPVKVPDPPELEVDSVQPEIPKLASSDAPGG